MLIKLISWKNFTSEFLDSIKFTGLWKLLVDRLDEETVEASVEYIFSDEDD